MEKHVILGEAFEDLTEEQMQEIDGGLGLETSITTWSSLPCTASMVVSATVVIVTYAANK